MNPISRLFLSTLFLGACGSLHAQTFTEGSDAGDRAASALSVPVGTTAIEGTFAPGTGNPFEANPADVDVYAFFLAAPAAVAIEATSDECDLNLLLLGQNFRGLAANDDRAPGEFDASIQLDLAPGLYYIAVGQNNTAAFPAGAGAPGDGAWDNDSGLLSPAEAAVPIAFIGADDEIPAPTDGEGYEITFNFSSGFSGLDLSVGKRPNRFLGVGFLSNDGSGQTVRVKGGESATHYLQLKNAGLERIVSARLRGVSGTVPIEVTELGRKKRNVTAAFLTGRYRQSIELGGSLRYSVTVSGATKTPLVPPRGTRSPVVTEPIGRLTLLTTMSDASDAAVTDTVGAKVQVR